MTEMVNEGVLEENPTGASETLWYTDGYKYEDLCYS